MAILSIPPVVLMYHGVPRRGVAQSLNAQAFEQHILWLKRHCTFIRPEQCETERGSLRRPAVLLTFDDGLRNNAEVAAPILRRHGVPAVFFVTSRHCTPGKYMWFTYLKMLAACFPGDGVALNGSFIPLKGAERPAGIAKLRRQLLALQPHPQAMHDAIDRQFHPLESFLDPDVLADECAGMTTAQVRELAHDPLFTVGGHTVDHPVLTRCSREEAFRQLSENKTWLEGITGTRCELFAYPAGDFDGEVLEYCRGLGFRRAFAVESRAIADAQFAVPRVGIYQNSLASLAAKLWCGHLLPTRPMQKTRAFVNLFRSKSQPAAYSPRAAIQ